MSSNLWQHRPQQGTPKMMLLMRALLILLCLLCLFGTIRADLPSCIRAKCTHCRVPFIAEMCPGACAICGGGPVGKLFITTAQQPAQVLQPDARAFGQAQVNVPFAQQLPLPASVGRTAPQQQRLEAVAAPNGGAVHAQQPPRQQPHQQRVIHRGLNNNNNNNHNGPRQQQHQQQQQIRNHYGTDFGPTGAEQQQLQLPIQQNQQGQFVPPNQQNQQGQFVPPGGQFVPQSPFGAPPDQGQQQQSQFVAPSQQQTTSFGGFYNQQQQPDQFYPQAGFGPVPPPPPPIQPTDASGAGGTFGNPFQPFLQQSFNSAQQFQPQQPQNGFTFAPPINSGGTAPVPSQTAQFGTPIQPQQPQQYFGQYNQQQHSNGNNNFNNGQYNGNYRHNNNQQEQQQPFAPQAAVLHAVPNVADPLQRPRQLYPAVSQEPSDKNLQNLVEPPNNYLLDKGAALIGDEGKKPFSAINANGFIPGENGQTCPKQPNWEPCVPKDIANQRFRNCCARLGDGCSQLCSYDQNLGSIQLAVLTGRCPVSRVGDMMVCASGNEDATACCQEFGVFESGFDHCRPYCNPSGGLPNDGMLAEKYRCLQKLQQIQKCFYLTQRP